MCTVLLTVEMLISFRCRDCQPRQQLAKIGAGSGDHQWSWMYKNGEAGNCLHEHRFHLQDE